MPRTGQLTSLLIAILCSFEFTLAASANEIDWTFVLQAAKNGAPDAHKEKPTDHGKKWLDEIDARTIYSFAQQLVLSAGAEIELIRSAKKTEPFLSVTANGKANAGLAKTGDRIITAKHVAFKGGPSEHTLNVVAVGRNAGGRDVEITIKLNESKFVVDSDLLHTSHDIRDIKPELRPLVSNLSKAEQHTDLTFSVDKKTGNTRLESKTAQGATLLPRFGIPYRMLSSIFHERGGAGRMHISRTQNGLVVRITKPQVTAEIQVLSSTKALPMPSRRVSVRYNKN